jgi:acyl dehydratase
MGVTADGLLALEVPEKEYVYGDRETMLYALGVGLGDDPMNAADLPYVFERDLKVIPTQATVVAWNDRWIFKSGLNLFMIVHGEQRIRLHKPLPPAATVLSRMRVSEVVDKGPGKGAIIYVESVLTDKASGDKLVTSLSTIFARGDGGIGGKPTGGPEPHQLPDRAPDVTWSRRTQPNQALIYRLSGDRNPLHADPEFAKVAKFPRPILHGLCTYGHACVGLVKAALDDDPTRIASFEARFSAPVFPGETIKTEIWRDGDLLSFRAVVPERDNIVVLSNGRAELRG